MRPSDSDSGALCDDCAQSESPKPELTPQLAKPSVPPPNLFLLLLTWFATGLVMGGAVNWAAYTLAWNPRPISPWAPPSPKARPRRWTDRIPLVGWWGLRREVPLHGKAFWIRPILVELMLGLGLAALGWWEIVERGLTTGQWDALASQGLVPRGTMAPLWTAWLTWGSHAVLIGLMAAASMIDIDEKIIPDTITVPGALLGLLIALCAPLALLPHCDVRVDAPPVGVLALLRPDLPPQGAAQAYVEPVTSVAPNLFARAWQGAPHWQGLACGVGCYAFWCVALTPRIWRGRHGWRRALRVVTARIRRELARPPLLWIEIVGLFVIVGAWWRGGPHWIGLLTGLIGMIGSGAMVWAVRLIGSAALRREAMGFGDVTLMMMVGAYLGWQAGVIIFFLAPFAGLVAGVGQAIWRRDDVIPYGPFLCIGTLGVMVRWADIWRVGGLQDLFAMPWLVPAALSVCMVLLGGLLLVWRLIKEAVWGVCDDD